MKEGKKNDYQDGKLRWDLLPLEEIEDIVKLYTAVLLSMVITIGKTQRMVTNVIKQRC